MPDGSSPPRRPRSCSAAAAASPTARPSTPMSRAAPIGRPRPRSHRDPARLPRRRRRQRWRGEGQACSARQPRASGQRPRLPVDRARLRCPPVRSRHTVADEIPEANASKSGRERVIARARRDNLTVRQLAQIAGSYGGLAMVGTPKTIVDQMRILSAAPATGSTLCSLVPGGLDDSVDRVVPELQRRGLFRREYEGRTLRENLGLPRPENRFFRRRPPDPARDDAATPSCYRRGAMRQGSPVQDRRCPRNC